MLTKTSCLFLGQHFHRRHEERRIRRPLPLRRGPKQGRDQMQRQRGRNPRRLLQADGAGTLHRQPQVCRPARARVAVRCRRQWRGIREADRKDQEDEGGRPHHRGRQPVQAHLQDARSQLLRPEGQRHFAHWKGQLPFYDPD